MHLENLKLTNFKNYTDLDIDFCPNINCFVGNNGVGKTNLLDAIYYLSFCKSFFNPVDTQNIRISQDFFAIHGRYASPSETGQNVTVSCIQKRNSAKQIRWNKAVCKSISEHIGRVPLVMVSPADQSLVSGGSEERRRFIDMGICQYVPAYTESLIRYNKALQQRNVMLKQEEEFAPDVFLVFEEQMAREGEYIFRRRSEYIEQLVPVFQQFYNRISQEQEMVELRYISHCQRGPLLEQLVSQRYKDKAVGYSLHGIHKDDLEMLQNGYPVRREGSQGQSKTFLIALKLAQFDFLSRTGTRTTPLLLLDDIFDKLDAERVEQIVKLVGSDRFGQIFITDTNRDHLDTILASMEGDNKMFIVEKGECCASDK